MQQVKQSFTLRQLPPELTPFVGRTQEVAQLVRLLTDPTCRLVTLVGLGGIGKTRLALATAAQVADVFQGVHFVPLQALDSPDYIINAIAEAIRFQVYESGDPKTQLLDYLRDEQVLLVMDNFEHLLDGADIVNDILANAPNIKILATSRVALNLQEEWVYQVTGMHTPAEDSESNLENYSAVRLFIQIARRIRADFSPEAEQDGIVRICKLVQGMPLAIELAASWVRSLSCTEIADEIESSLDFLETPIRNIPTRHRNMRYVLEQTWKLLSEPERDVFKRLSVFRGSFTREAAQIVAGASLRVLGAFVDKSLLRRNDTGRYDLHELLRQFAAEQLNTSLMDSEQTRGLHCHYYMEFLEQRWASLTGKQTKEALNEIEEEIENIRASWTWAIDHRLDDEIDKAMDSLWFFYDTRGWYREAERTFARGVRALSASNGNESVLLAKMLARQGSICYSLDVLEKAGQMLEESLAMLKRLNARKEMAFSYLRLGEVLVQQHEHKRAQEHYEESLTIFRENGDNWGTAYALNWLGHSYLHFGDYQTAERLAQESLAINQAMGNRWGIANNMDSLGCVALFGFNKAEEAQTYAQESLAICQDIGLRWGLPLALNLLAWTSHRMGNYNGAWCYIHQALSIAVELHLTSFILDNVMTSGILAAQQGSQAWGIELMSAAFNHPYGDQLHDWTKPYLTELKSTVNSEVFTAAWERGKAGEFDVYVQTLLADPDEPCCDGSPPPADSPRSADALTPRELEILQFIATGLSNREIAEKMIFSVGTVKWYINQIYGKLQVASRTQAVARGRELALIA